MEVGLVLEASHLSLEEAAPSPERLRLAWSLLPPSGRGSPLSGADREDAVTPLDLSIPPLSSAGRPQQRIKRAALPLNAKRAGGA